MASVQVEINHGEASRRCTPLLLPWKLYHNPHYRFFHEGHSLGVSSSSSSSSSSRPSSCQGRGTQLPMIVAFDDNDGVELDQGYGAMSSELELCVDRIRELRAELEFERRMRRKAEALGEALAAELAEERRRSEAAEAECRALREEAGAARAEVERALEAVDEERRMLRVAELWREERVQMKLADARAAMEEKQREIDDAVAKIRVSGGGGNSRSSCCSNSSPVGKSSPSRSQHGQHSPSRSHHHHGQMHRRDGENPHIRRGIKGFVEFPKAVRVVRPREERVDLVSNLECQRAQLRVLMRHRSPAGGGMGLIAAPENLVV